MVSSWVIEYYKCYFYEPKPYFMLGLSKTAKIAIIISLRFKKRRMLLSDVIVHFCPFIEASLSTIPLKQNRE